MPVRARMEVPPLTGFATRPGKMYLLLFVQRSVYSAPLARARRNERDGARGGRAGLLEVEVEKKLPGDGRARDDVEYKFQRRSHLRSRRPDHSRSHGAASLLFGLSIRKAGA